MNTPYLITMASAALVSGAVFALRLHRRGIHPGLAAAGAAISALFGLLGAKLFYVALLFQRVWPRFGWEAFTRMRGAEFSFFGGCAGAALGMALTAKLFQKNARVFLGIFAPCGALMAAGARYAERYLGMLGVGSITTHPLFSRFPFAVENQWHEAFQAVFMLEALGALAVAAAFFLRRREDLLPGLAMERTAFYLCLGQILFESLRSQGMKWGFVRVEQLLSAVCVMGLLFYGCLKAEEGGGWKRFWPLLCALACIGLFIAVEFGLDKTNLPRALLYGAMILGLGVLSLLERRCSEKRLERERAGQYTV